MQGRFHAVKEKLFLSTPSARRATESYNRVTYIRFDFYPRPPRGGRLRAHRNGHRHYQISIHALREEGDPDRYDAGSDASKFLSTPSARRATGSGAMRGGIRLYFYPRPPRGGRLSTSHLHNSTFCISIHALREEGDFPASVARPKLANFYPRPPRGGRHGRSSTVP